MASSQDSNERRVLGFLGIGLDSDDGHQRLTQSEHFFLIGGSDQTHERMQDTAIRFAEALKRRGKKLEEASLAEILAILHASQP